MHEGEVGVGGVGIGGVEASLEGRGWNRRCVLAERDGGVREAEKEREETREGGGCSTPPVLVAKCFHLSFVPVAPPPASFAAVDSL